VLILSQIIDFLCVYRNALFPQLINYPTLGNGFDARFKATFGYPALSSIASAFVITASVSGPLWRRPSLQH
jgi:hypothetical protein